MKLKSDEARPQSGGKKAVSRVDAVAIMVIAAAAGLATTVMTVAAVISYASGPVTLELPVATTSHTATGLLPGVTGHFTDVEVTFPAALPSGPAELLVWGGVLNQIGFLAALALVFLLAHRLRSEILFTPGSARVVGVCGAVLTVFGTMGQVLDAIARSRLAEMVGANARTPGESYGFSAEFNIAPLLLGLVLVLVSGVFQFGRRLQNDTEGLV